MPGQTWRIGDLARAAGVTVRALRHYDQIGLLCPSGRSESKQRLYSVADVERLYRICVLRGLGVPLREIGAALRDEQDGLRAAARRHLERVERQIDQQHRLHTRLMQLLATLETGTEPAPQQLFLAMEAMNMLEKHYTTEQLAGLEQRRRAVGEQVMRQAEQEWLDLIASVDAARRAGLEPASPVVQELARRWSALTVTFTGGDQDILDALQQMYESEGAERASRGAVTSEVMQYMQQAMAVSDGWQER